jgi:hypothetical protein
MVVKKDRIFWVLVTLELVFSITASPSPFGGLHFGLESHGARSLAFLRRSFSHLQFAPTRYFTSQ